MALVIVKMMFFNWDKVCKPKQECGFNVKEALAWNKALLCKWFLKIKSDVGIWAKWAIAYSVNDVFQLG